MQIAKNLFIFLFLSSAFVWGYRGDVIERELGAHLSSSDDDEDYSAEKTEPESDVTEAAPIAVEPTPVGQQPPNQGFGEIVERMQNESPIPATTPIHPGFSVPANSPQQPLSLDVPNYVPPENLNPAPSDEEPDQEVATDEEEDSSVDEEEEDTEVDEIDEEPTDEEAADLEEDQEEEQ